MGQKNMGQKNMGSDKKHITRNSLTEMEHIKPQVPKRLCITIPLEPSRATRLTAIETRLSAFRAFQ